MKRRLATLFVALSSAFVAFGFASCQIIQWQPDWGLIENVNRYEIELDTTEFESVVPYDSEFDYQSIKLVYKAYLGEEEQPFYESKISLKPNMVTGGLDTTTPGEKELIIEYGGESFLLPYVVKYQVDFLSKGEVFNTQYVLSADEVVLPEEADVPKVQGYTFSGDWKSEVPEVLTENVAIEAHYYNNALHAPALETIHCTYDPNATVAQLTLPSNKNGNWEFVDPALPVGDAGSHEYEVRFVSKTDELAPVANELVKVQVAKKAVAAPAVSASLVYAATTQKATVTDVETDDSLYAIVNEGGINAGNYSATATLKDVKNYVWKDTDNWTEVDEATGILTFKYTIAPKQVEFVIASETFTYNRGEQFPTYTFADGFDNAHITAADVTVTGTPQVNADTYEYGFAMNNANYVGSYSGTFTIEQKELTFIVDSKSFVYDGTEHYPTYSFADSFADPEDLPNVRVMSGKPQTEAGSGYKYGWLVMDDNYTGMHTGTFEITKPDVTVTAVLAQTEITYPAAIPEITFTVEGFAGDKTLLNITVEKPTANVGTHEITPVVNNANVNATCVSATLTINKGTPEYYRPTLSTDGWQGTAAIYGDTISTVTFNDEGFGTWAWKNPDLVIDRMSDFSAVAVFTPQDPNLNQLEKELFITNEDRQIAKRTLNIVVTKNEYTYTGEELALEYTIVDATDPEGYTIELDKLTVSGNSVETEAGEHNKTLEIVSDYYKGVVSPKLIIHKATPVVSLTVDHGNVTYRPALTLANSGLTPIGTAHRANDDEPVEGTFTWANGSYSLSGLAIGVATPVEVVFTPTGEKANNYNSVILTYNVTVDKADSVIQKVEGGNKVDLLETYEKVYDEAVFQFEAQVSRENELPDTSTITYTYKNVATGVESATITEAGEYKLTISVGATTHYNGATATVIVRITQASNEWKDGPAIRPYSSWTYKNQGSNQIFATAKFGTSTIVITYTNTTTGTVYNNADNKLPTDAEAGTYVASVVLPETSNWAGLSAEVTFTVNKAKVTTPNVGFGASNSTKYTGQAQIPTVNGSYENGSIGGVGYTVEYLNRDSIDVGTYQVRITLNDATNYVWSGTDSNVYEAEYKIEQATNQITSLSIDGWKYLEYDAAENAPVATATFGSLADISYSYYTTPANAFNRENAIPLDEIKVATVKTYFVRADIAVTENYTAASAIQSFNISNADLTDAQKAELFAQPYAVTWSSGITLAAISLDDHYTWDDSTTELTAGKTKNYPATYKIDNYNAVTGKFTVTVNKITSTVTASDKSFTYDKDVSYTAETLGGLIGVTVTRKDGVNNGTDVNEITYVISYKANETAEPETVTTIQNAGIYTVTVNLAESEHFTSATTTVTITVKKVENKQTIPEMKATYGDTLSIAKDSDGKTLSDYNDTYGEWTWEDGNDTSVGNATTHTYTAKYTPKAEYAVNYAGRTGVEVTVIVAKKAIALPTLTKTSFVYNGSVQKPEIPASDDYSVSNWSNENSTNVANNYTVTLKLSDENYAWSGTGASVSGLNATYTYAITKATLTVTENKVQTATYGDKVVEKLTLPVSKFNGTVVGSWKWNIAEGTTVGNYGETNYFEAVCTLSEAEKVNFITPSNVYIAVTVNAKATPTLTVTDNCHKTYDGTAFAFAEGDISISHDETAEISYQYKLADSTEEAQSGLPTNAGTYTVTVTLSESANYEGTSTTVTVTIEQATPTATVENVAVGANLFGLREQIGNPTYGTWDWTHATNTPFTDAKTYECKVPFLRNSNNYKTEGIITVYVGKAAVSATIALDSNVYTGSEIRYTVTVGNTVGTLTEGTQYTVEWKQYTVTCDTIQNAGEYTVTLTLLPDTFEDYLWATTDSTVTIQGAVLTKKITIASATNGWKDDKKPTVSGGVYKGSAYVANTEGCTALFGTYETKYYKVEGSVETELIGVPANAGSYRVRFVGDVSGNYAQLNDFLDFTITPKAITPQLSAENLVYNKDAQIVTASTEDSKEEGVTEFTVTCENATVEGKSISVTNAGNYTVVFTLTSDNYVWKDNVNTVSFAVARKQITETDVKAIANATKDSTYDGANKLPALTGYEGFEAEITKAEAFAGTIVNKGVDAGNYTLTLKLTDATNYEFADGLTLTYDFTINRAKATATITKTSATYNGSTHSPTISVTSGVKYKVNGGEEITGNRVVTETNAGTYTYAITLVDTTNFELTAGSELTFTIAKSQLKATVTNGSFTFDNNAHTATYQVVSTNGGATAGYKMVDGDSNTATHAGTHKFHLTLTNTTNYVWEGTAETTVELSFEIKQATNTWSTPPAIDEGNAFTYGTAYAATATATYGNDTLKVTYATKRVDGTWSDYSTTKTTNAGTYQVKFSVAETKDYTGLSAEITYTIQAKRVDIPGIANTTETYVADRPSILPTYETNDDYTVAWTVDSQISEETRVNGVDVGEYTITISLNNVDGIINYKWIDGTSDALTATYTITPAPLDVSNTENQSAIYGDKLSSLSLPTTTVGTWAWKDSDNTPVGNVGNHSFTAVCTLTGKDAVNYNPPDEQTITVTVSASSNYTVTGTTSVSVDWSNGLTLNGVEIPTLTATSTLDGALTGTYTWLNDTTALTDCKEYFVKLRFEPDNANYAERDIDVTVTVNKVKASILNVSETYSMTYGEELPTINEYANHKEAEITRSYERKLADGTYKRVDSLTNADAGTYRIIFSLVETDHYKSAVAEANVTIAKKAITPSNVKVNYTDDSNVLIDGAATTTNGTKTNGTKYYYENLMPKLSEIISYNVTGVNGELDVSTVLTMQKETALSSATTTDGVMLGTKTVTVTFTLKNDADKVNYEIVYPKAADGSSLNYYPVTVTLKGVAYIGDTYYGTIENAVTYANEKGGGTVWVVPDTTGKVVIKGIPDPNNPETKKLTIGPGVTLVLPYADKDALETARINQATNGLYEAVYYNGNDRNGNSKKGTLQLITRVVMETGSSLEVNGKLQIAGELNGGGNSEKYAGNTGGKYAELVMKGNSQIIVNNGGTVQCFGFILEESLNNQSKITVNNGGIFAMPFVVRDFRGGSFMYGTFGTDGSKGGTPFNQFEMRNVTAALRIDYGAQLLGYANLATVSRYSQNATTISLIGTTSSYLIQLSTDNSYVTAKYNTTIQNYTVATDGAYCELHIYGGAITNKMTLNISIGSADTSQVYFPLTWRYQITLHDGAYTMGQKFKMMPGSQLTVEENASLTIGELSVYDASFTDPYGSLKYDTGKGEAVLTVNGSLTATVLGGKVYTNSSGATITVTTATVTTKETVSISGSSIFASAAFTEITKVLELPKFDNANANYNNAGTYYSVVRRSDNNTTFGWYPANITITYETSGGDAITPATWSTQPNGGGHIIVDGDLPTPTKTGTEFLGWYLDSSFTQPVEIGVTTLYDHTTLYAKWSIATYSVRFVGSDGTTLGSINGIEEGQSIFSSGNTLPDLSQWNNNMDHQYYYEIDSQWLTNAINASTTVTITAQPKYKLTIKTAQGGRSPDGKNPGKIPTYTISLSNNGTDEVDNKGDSSGIVNSTGTIYYVAAGQYVKLSITNGNGTNPYSSYTPITSDTTQTITGAQGENSGCVTPETLITLADGNQVMVKDLTGNELLLTWNHATGKFEATKIAYIVSHDSVDTEHLVTTLYFEDGKQVEIIAEHVFFDTTIGRYVTLTAENVGEYIGHSFSMLENDGLSVTKLVKAESEIRMTRAYEVVTYQTLTCFTNGVLSCSGYIEVLLNMFEINSETMCYDSERIAEDIATYGLYTYEDFADLVPEEVYEMYNAKYLKIAVGKGLITWEGIEALIDFYYSLGIQPLQ